MKKVKVKSLVNKHINIKKKEKLITKKNNFSYWKIKKRKILSECEKCYASQLFIYKSIKI